MAKIYLTDAAVERRAAPKAGRLEISDSEPGLFLWITPNGTKTWMAIFRLSDATGKRSVKRKMALGRFPSMKVAEAREKAREVMALAEAGVDPVAKAEEDRAAQERVEAEQAAGTFGAVADDYVAAMRAGKLVGGRKRPVAETTAAGRASLLNRLVLPAFGKAALSEVTPSMVARLLAKIEAEGGPVDETLKVIRGVFKFAQSRGLFHGALPTAGMSNRQPPKKVTRALDDGELAAIWLAAREQGWPFGSIIRLLMLTGQRKTEIALLRWEEVDWDRKLLVIPADRVKNRAGAHEVPLSEPALEILREAAEAYDALTGRADPDAPRTGLVFPSASGCETPISGWSKLKPKLDRRVRGMLAGLTDREWRLVQTVGFPSAENEQAKVAALAKIEAVTFAPWRIHDLRHTFITRCRDGEENAEGEIVWSAPLDVLQATVNHEITAGVTARYDHGDVQRRYRLRKRELMDWWARKLMILVCQEQACGRRLPLMPLPA